jgi:predicted AlkP superfamily phosphohydrolase/phosphomutase
MDGCFCINQWLIEKGYLALKTPVPSAGTPIEKAAVDWSRTKAWGAGGYYARIFFNVKGREPEGIVEPQQVPELTARLDRELAAVIRPDGQPLGSQVLPPAKIYREVRGDAPDLMVYFGNLKWRSAGTLGHEGMFLSENDTGPDDSVHSFEGIYVVAGGGHQGRGRGPEEKGIDIGATVLTRMGQPLPPRMQGKPISSLA